MTHHRAALLPLQVWWFDLAAAAPGGRASKQPRKPQLLYHQPDERFHLRLWLSRSGAGQFGCT